MSFRLFEIPEAIEMLEENLVDIETGEILSQEDANKMIEELQIEADKKTEWIAKEILNLKAEAEALKAQKQSFEKRQRSAERRAESLKNYLKFALNGEKWKAEDSSVSVSYRNTKNCVSVTDIDAIENKFFRTPHTESNLNKTMLKDALLNGEQIWGVKLEDRTSIIIK